MLTGLGDEDVIVTAMKKGAMDYMSKERLSGDVLRRIVYKAIEKGILLNSLYDRQLEKDRLIYRTAGSPCPGQATKWSTTHLCFLQEDTRRPWILEPDRDIHL